MGQRFLKFISTLYFLNIPRINNSYVLLLSLLFIYTFSFSISNVMSVEQLTLGERR